MQAQLQWDDFIYKEKIFAATGTQKSPWVVIKGNDKDLARKEAMKQVLKNVNYEDKRQTEVILDFNPEVVKIFSH
jgi:polyphosphate kinase 2 (PPK2 family)